jgi:hypothetical protein
MTRDQCARLPLYEQMQRSLDAVGQLSCCLFVWARIPCGCRGDGLVEVVKQSPDVHAVFAGAIGDGVVGRDVTADTVHSVVMKDRDGLWIAPDDLLHQAGRRDLLGRVCGIHAHHSLPVQCCPWA